MPLYAFPAVPPATRAYEIGIHEVDIINAADPLNPAAGPLFPRARRFPEIYPFQELAARHLMDQKSAAVLGSAATCKVEIASAAASTYLDDPGVQRVVIITSPTQVTNWAYLTNGLGYDDVWVPSGPPGPRWRNYTTCDARWIVVPYSLADRDVEVLETLMPTSLLVLDAVSQIRTQTAARTLAALRLRRRAFAQLSLLLPAIHYNTDEWGHLVWSALDPHRLDRETTRQLARHLRGLAPQTGVLTATSKD
jgi:hypothetical protein